MSAPSIDRSRQIRQPVSIEYATADGIMVKTMTIPDAYTIVPQHAHTYDHLSMLAVGRVEVWLDGALKEVAEAPRAIEIKAGTKHRFVSLVDGCVIYCVHHLHGYDGVSVMSEHELEVNH